MYFIFKCIIIIKYIIYGIWSIQRLSPSPVPTFYTPRLSLTWESLDLGFEKALMLSAVPVQNGHHVNTCSSIKNDMRNTLNS